MYDQRGRREDGFGGQSNGRNRGGLRHEVQDVGNFGDPHEVGISEWVESPGRQTAGLDLKRAPASREGHPHLSGSWAASQGRESRDEASGPLRRGPEVDPASRVQRGCWRAVSPREDSPRQCRDGRGDEQSREVLWTALGDFEGRGPRRAL